MAETKKATAAKTKSCYAVTRQAVSEQVAIAEAIAKKLGSRHGQRTDLSTYGNISISETGATRVTVETARQFKPEILPA